MASEPGNAVEKFWRRVEKRRGCWGWRGYIDSTGYAQFNPVPQHPFQAHRFSKMLVVGMIPLNSHVHHICRNRKCVNPEHLQVLTSKEHGHITNRFTFQTHCVYGHAFNETNTHYHKWRGKVRRVCRTCDRLRQRRKRHNRGLVSPERRRESAIYAANVRWSKRTVAAKGLNT